MLSFDLIIYKKQNLKIFWLFYIIKETKTNVGFPNWLILNSTIFFDAFHALLSYLFFAEHFGDFWLASPFCIRYDTLC